MANDEAKRRPPSKKGRDQRRTRGHKPEGAARASVDKRPASAEDLVEATHEVIEEEVREGEATTVLDPDQKHERGSGV
jgi:hypothetical protein